MCARRTLGLAVGCVVSWGSLWGGVSGCGVSLASLRRLGWAGLDCVVNWASPCELSGCAIVL